MKMFATVFLLAFLYVVVSSSEPECSSFHFVEKTLEKMIKTEIYVDQMKSEMENKQQNMSKTVDGIRTDWEKTKLDLKTAKEDNRRSIDEIEAKMTAPVQAVAFHAHNIKNIQPDDGETLIFSTTIFDKSSGYNNETGVYVTPVGGVYMFNVQLCINSRRYFYFEITSGKASILKGSFIDETSSYAGCRTATTVAVLDAKEKVWIKSGSSSSGADLWKDSDVWNSFSGVLINAIF